MANIETNNLAFELTEEAMKAWEAIKDKLPDIGELNKNPDRLLNLQGENADVIGALYKDSIGLAEYSCRNGRAIIQCAQEINRIDRKLGLALLAGGAALCLGGYIYMKLSHQENQIKDLQHRVAALELAQ